MCRVLCYACACVYARVIQQSCVSLCDISCRHQGSHTHTTHPGKPGSPGQAKEKGKETGPAQGKNQTWPGKDGKRCVCVRGMAGMGPLAVGRRAPDGENYNKSDLNWAEHVHKKGAREQNTTATAKGQARAGTQEGGSGGCLRWVWTLTGKATASPSIMGHGPWAMWGRHGSMRAKKGSHHHRLQFRGGHTPSGRVHFSPSCSHRSLGLRAYLLQQPVTQDAPKRTVYMHPLGTHPSHSQRRRKSFAPR